MHFKFNDVSIKVLPQHLRQFSLLRQLHCLQSDTETSLVQQDTETCLVQQQDTETYMVQDDTATCLVKDVDDALFVDLVALCTLCTTGRNGERCTQCTSGRTGERCTQCTTVIGNATRWLATKVARQRAGYLRDLYALHCFLGNDCECAQAVFCALFQHLLAHNEKPSAEALRCYFGLAADGVAVAV